MTTLTVPVQHEAFVRKAMLAEGLAEGRVRCHPCAFRCIVGPGLSGNWPTPSGTEDVPTPAAPSRAEQ